MQCHVHGPNNAFCVSFRPIVSFFAFFSNFTITTTILPPQVNATQHNSNLHQPPPTPFALHHVHGLNDMQNTSFRPIVCFFYFILFILLLLTNVLPHQVGKTRPNDGPHQPPPTPFTLHHAHGMFYFFIFILLLLTNALPRQVGKTRPNNDPHQPPPTPFALCHAHGLNNTQNASFRPMVCFIFLF